MVTNYYPFFILGNPRSGTTLLRLMLDAHSEISVPPECGFLIWFYDKYKNKKFKNEKDVEIFVSDLKTAKKIDSWALDFKKLGNSLTTNLPFDYAGLINFIYLFYAIDKDKNQYWGDKNNFYINHINELSTLFPKAKFIHIVRDGRDVACSYKELNSKQIISEFAPKLPANILEISKEWCANNEMIIRDVEQFSEKSNYLLVRYEDLIFNATDELSKITTFLNLDYEQEMLLYYKNSKTYEPKEYLQWKAKTKKPPTSSSIGRYKIDLSTKEQDEFNVTAKTTLQRFNYEL